MINLTKQSVQGNLMLVFKDCSINKEPYKVFIRTEDWTRWKSGEPIQKVCPYLTSNEKEFLISGFTPAEWEDLDFNEEVEQEWTDV